MALAFMSSSGLQQLLNIGCKHLRPAAIAGEQAEVAFGVIDVATGGVVHGVAGRGLAVDTLVIHLEIFCDLSKRLIVGWSQTYKSWIKCRGVLRHELCGISVRIDCNKNNLYPIG